MIRYLTCLPVSYCKRRSRFLQRIVDPFEETTVVLGFAILGRAMLARSSWWNDARRTGPLALLESGVGQGVELQRLSHPAADRPVVERKRPVTCKSSPHTARMEAMRLERVFRLLLNLRKALPAGKRARGGAAKMRQDDLLRCAGSIAGLGVRAN